MQWRDPESVIKEEGKKPGQYHVKVTRDKECFKIEGVWPNTVEILQDVD